MVVAVTEEKGATQKQVSPSHLFGDAYHEQTFHSNVAEVAYLKAEKRGFLPGFELDDWLEAEQECRLS